MKSTNGTELAISSLHIKLTFRLARSLREYILPLQCQKTQIGRLERIGEETATDPALTQSLVLPFVVDFLKMKPIRADPVKITILCYLRVKRSDRLNIYPLEGVAATIEPSSKRNWQKTKEKNPPPKAAERIHTHITYIFLSSTIARRRSNHRLSSKQT